MKKKIIIFIITVLIIILTLVVGLVAQRVFNIGLGDSSNTNEDLRTQYKSNMKMDYIEQNGTRIKVDYLSMNEKNLNIVFNFTADEDISNYEGIYLPSLLITDENGNQIFLDTEAPEHNNSFAKSMGDSALGNNKNTIRELYYLKSDKFPDSKKLYLSFKTITLYNTNKGNPFSKEIDGDWNIELNVNNQ